MKPLLITLGVFIIALTGLSDAGQAALPSDDLAAGFAYPPDAAKPRVYWWWLNSLVNKEGITRDLEEYKAKGIGDARLPEDKRLTKTNVNKFKPGSPLLPSGLLGPVTLGVAE